MNTISTTDNQFEQQSVKNANFSEVTDNVAETFEKSKWIGLKEQGAQVLEGTVLIDGKETFAFKDATNTIYTVDHFDTASNGKGVDEDIRQTLRNGISNGELSINNFYVLEVGEANKNISNTEFVGLDANKNGPVGQVLTFDTLFPVTSFDEKYGDLGNGKYVEKKGVMLGQDYLNSPVKELPVYQSEIDRDEIVAMLADADATAFPLPDHLAYSLSNVEWVGVQKNAGDTVSSIDPETGEAVQGQLAQPLSFQVMVGDIIVKDENGKDVNMGKFVKTQDGLFEIPDTIDSNDKEAIREGLISGYITNEITNPYDL